MICGLFVIVGAIGFLGSFIGFGWGAFIDKQDGLLTLFLSVLLVFIANVGLMFGKCQ